MAGGAALELGEDLASLGHRLQRALGVGKEGPAGRGQAHAVPPPDEQRRADGLLERVQPGGQRGLRDEERGARRG